MGLDEVDVLKQLFASERSTSHCWCMSFCTSRSHFAVGWFSGGNRRRFEAMATGDAVSWPPSAVRPSAGVLVGHDRAMRVLALRLTLCWVVAHALRTRPCGCCLACSSMPSIGLRA